MKNDSLIHILEHDLTPALYNEFKTAGMVAVDTETSGLDWSKERLELCQLYAPQIGVILVRSSEKRPSLLTALMENSNVTKVFHFAPFDLRFMAAQWDTEASGILCTKTASKLINPTADHADHSLINLVRSRLGITLSKGTVRTSNWGASSLTADQVAYAAEDVRHLLLLLSPLTKELAKGGLTDMFYKICEYMPVDAMRVTKGYPDPLAY